MCKELMEWKVLIECENFICLLQLRTWQAPLACYPQRGLSIGSNKTSGQINLDPGGPEKKFF